jgi:hypothetical protein
MNFTFEGLRTSLEPAWVVARDPHLTALRERFVSGGIDEPRAQRLVENLVVGAFAMFGHEYLGEMHGELDAVVKIRGELRARFDRALRLPPTGALPAELQPGALGPLQAELEMHLARLDGRSPTRAAADALPLSIEDALARYEGDDATGAALGDAPPTGIPDEGEGTPRDEPMTRASDPGAGLAVRSRAAEIERSFNRRAGIAPDARARWRVEVARVPDRAWGVAQTRGLSGLDPTFAGNGYELRITPPEAAGATFPKPNPRAPLEPTLRDYQFQPDGVHFVDGDRFEFLEWKHREDNPYFNYLDTPEGFERLKADMRKDLRNLEQLRGVGCVGFVWGTDSADVYDAFVRAAAEMHLDGITFMPRPQ